MTKEVFVNLAVWERDRENMSEEDFDEKWRDSEGTEWTCCKKCGQPVTHEEDEEDQYHHPWNWTLCDECYHSRFWGARPPDDIHNKYRLPDP